MCVACDTVYEKASYLAVQTDAAEFYNIPIVNGLVENHSFETINNILINASLIAIILYYHKNYLKNLIKHPAFNYIMEIIL